MRTIKKVIKVQEIELTVYDRGEKKEKVLTVTIAEGQEVPKQAGNQTLLESKILSEKDVTYTMTPETFMKYATPQKPEEKTE
jgi:hypothetical protein